MGFQVKLLDAGPYRGRVLVALRQLLQLDGASAARFVASAPVVVAVCGAPDAAERLRATLVGAGANVQVAGPPPAPRLEPVKPPKPEPRRYMAATARAVREPRAGRGVRTLTGLALGRGGTYLAFGRADASRLLAIPDLIRVEARVMVPTAVRLAGDSSAEIFGNEALQCWIEEPDEVSFGFIEDLSGEEDRAARATRGFLKFLKDRLVEVLGPGAVDAAAGAATAVAIPPEWPETQSSRLAAAVEQAGFPLTHLVPEPLAAVAAYVQQKREPVLVGAEHYLVIDWGSQGLDISVVESGPGGAWMTVIDHVEYPLGGMWFDMILENWLAERLGAELSDEDRRALSLFARLFKEEASLSFSESRTEHVQYCVVPAGMPPTRLSISKTEMDALFQDARAQFQTAVAEAPARLGFRPEHFDQVLLAGGAARWYFAGDAVRTALCRSSVVARDPEEVIARGLVLGAVRQGAETCPSK
ncbi:MAG TPA: Hsp70 family protein [Bryobacteraceae bacterium]|nr:Hsp70 family protein [Bryobacteraceae bacterium]